MSCSYITPVPRKYFTLAEANRTLPLVKRIVADLVTLHPEWRDLVSEYELVAAQARPDRRGGEQDQRLSRRARADRLRVQRIRAGTGGFLRQARWQGNILVLEAGRRENRALA